MHSILGLKKTDTLGVNFEGGKIINHVKRAYGELLAGYSNFQIAMDAPFHGMEANDSLRSKGPSERSIPDFNFMNFESTLFNGLLEVVNFACTNSVETIVIAIARGRSGVVFFKDDILSKLNTLGKIEFVKIKDNKYIHYNFKVCNKRIKLIVAFGYRSTEYFSLPMKHKFVFVNVGMYARLQFDPKITSGTLCVPYETYSMIMRDGRKTIVDKLNFTDDILFGSAYKFNKIKLIGVADDMPFVTTEHYELSDFC